MPAELFRAIGLLPDGPALLGRPIRAPGPGVYMVEQPAPTAVPRIDLSTIGKWIERVPGLRLDGEVPTAKALATRLAGFWLPDQTILYIGSSEHSVGNRVAALAAQALGDRRPHAAGQWLKTLAAAGLRVWWASTAAPEEYEDALLEAFAGGVSPAEAAALYDPELVLPFANLRSTTGRSKRHGITGSVLAEAALPLPPPGHVVVVAPGDADGARAETRGSGTVRRSTRSSPPVRAGANARPVAPRSVRDRPRTVSRLAEPVYISADGLTNLQAELDQLVAVRRPENVGRIRAAKELGDLKENADYHAAREEQSFLEGRIQALEARIRAAVVVAPSGDSSRVSMGSRVTADADGEQMAWTIVGSDESDPAAGRISHASPVGRALLGREIGDVAVVQTPRGEVRYRIVAID